MQFGSSAVFEWRQNVSQHFLPDYPLSALNPLLWRNSYAMKRRLARCYRNFASNRRTRFSARYHMCGGIKGAYFSDHSWTTAAHTRTKWE